jgi:hypothetical protein
VKENGLKILRSLRIEDDQASVSIGTGPFRRPILTADHNDLRIDDDALVMAYGQKIETAEKTVSYPRPV